MAVNVNVPQNPQTGAHGLALVGAGVGGYFGGTQGAGLGMSVGSALTPPPQTDNIQAAPLGGDALARRQQEIEQTPHMQVQQGLQALQQIPDQKTRDELAKPLLQADYMARQGG